MSPAATHTKLSKDARNESTENFSGRNSQTGLALILCTLLFICTIAVYMQSAQHRFLNLDDDVYVTNNRHVADGLTGENIVWAFSSIEEANWHPVTWLSHMADVQLYGMNPRGHHITNVMIHAVSTLLLFSLFFYMTNALWRSLFVAALFALHPLHVESVAWVAERKDLLSAFFLFITLGLYSRYVSTGKLRIYALTLITFALGLMSKSMLVTVPAIMFLLDFWPLNRFRGNAVNQCQNGAGTWQKNIVKEKIPFFAFSALSGAITIYTQQAEGAIASLTTLPFLIRIENALITYVTYIAKTIWPSNLAVYYPFPLYMPFWQVIGSLSVLSLLSLFAIRFRRSCPHITVGWFWFMVTLTPVIGLLQVGSQSMADRYTYIPLIGLFIMAAWGVPDLTKSLKHPQLTTTLSAIAALIALSALTWRQLGYWQNNYTLYNHALAVTKDNKKIHYNLGRAFAENGNLDAAIYEFREVIRINPRDADAYYNLGVALAGNNETDSAIMAYRTALQLNPDDIDTHNNLGRILAINGNLNEALQEFQAALRINPADKNAYYSIRSIYALQKK